MSGRNFKIHIILGTAVLMFFIPFILLGDLAFNPRLSIEWRLIVFIIITIGLILLVIWLILIIKQGKQKKESEIACKICGREVLYTNLIKCRICGRKICDNCFSASLNMCNGCKEEIELKTPRQQQSQQVIVQQVAPLAANMKHCIHCSNQIRDIAEFCDKCGKKQ